MSENIQIVDKHNRPTGGASRKDAWKKGWFYRTSQIVIEDGKGNLLLQRRSAKKTLYPLLWTNAASGGVDEGESYEETALREMKEEIGAITTLKQLGIFPIEEQFEGHQIKQFCGTFRGILPQSTNFILQTEEVAEINWFPLEQIQQDVIAHPERFTPIMIEVMKRYYL